MLTADALREGRRAEPFVRADGGFRVVHDAIQLQTRASLQFIDLTETVQRLVAASGIHDGTLNVQTRHTTTAVIVNENEPLLLEDMKRMLERIAPENDDYRHNDFAVRTVNMTPEERPNGHSHCRSLVLGCSATLNVLDGAIQLGPWQRIFFIELDHARPRTVSVTTMGLAG